MKKTVFALLSVLVLAGCYEKTTMPEGLTADNFYIGTFTFTDFADGEKPESYTVVTTKDTMTISDSNGKVYIDNANLQEERFLSVTFNTAKSFDFSLPYYYPEYYESGTEHIFNYIQTGTEEGVSFNLYEAQDLNNLEKYPPTGIYFSTYKKTIDDNKVGTKYRYPQTLEWNGKRYKSTVEAAFAK